MITRLGVLSRADGLRRHALADALRPVPW